MATTTTVALSMKLLVDRKAQRVLFAEAGKDAVDFLFSLVALPVATAVKLVGTDAMVGSVGNLYASIDKLDTTYVQPGAAKDALLRPTVVSPAAGTTTIGSSLLRLPEPSPPGQQRQPKTLYRCANTASYNSSCRAYVADAYGKACPSCYSSMTTEVQYLSSAAQTTTALGAAAAKGLVQGIVTYTVMDDLTVTPMSAISSTTLLSTFAVRDPADLQEKTVQLGYDEVNANCCRIFHLFSSSTVFFRSVCNILCVEVRRERHRVWRF
jgi:hypothetical protein